MNICMCGYQPGDHSHRPFCPYPLFRGSEADERAWITAEQQARNAARVETGRQPEPQPCRDCGEPFPYNPEADRCARCIAANIDTPLDPDWPGESGYAWRGDPCSWDTAA